MCIGKVSSRGGVVYEDKNPKSFWLSVVLYYLGGLFLIWLYFHAAK